MTRSRRLLGIWALVSGGLLLVWGAEAAQGQCQVNEFVKRQASGTVVDDHFGESVAISGDIAVIGIPHDYADDRGSAWVFRFDGLSWDQEQQLLPGDPGAAQDYFGWSVAVSGYAAVVGVYYDDDNGANSGSAYVFRFNGSSWFQQAKLLPSDGAAGERFGESVAVSGDFAIIGTPHDDANGASSGSAYVFQFNGSNWVQQAKLLPSDGEANEYFGSSVAISGDTAVIGTPWDDDNGNASGSAYVFQFDGSNWVQQAKLLASDGAESDLFGDSVSVSDEIALIGAWGDDDNGNASGSAYVFHFDGSNWVQQAKLLASDGAESDFFGNSVSISGDIAVISAHQDDDNGFNSGSAYVFRFDGSNWVEDAKLLASDGAADDIFGTAVAVSGQGAVIGAPHDDDDGADSGSVYFFGGLSDCNANGVLDACDIVDGTSPDNNGNGIPDECEPFYANEWAKLLASDGETEDYFGCAVAISGDTAVVGAYRDVVGPYGYMLGSAYVFRHDGSSWTEEQKLLASDGEHGDIFGWSVAICNDTIVIGNYVDNNDNGLWAGGAYVFRFNGSSWVEEQKLLASDGAAQDLFGRSVGVCDDIVVIGADGDDDDCGAAYVFRYDGSSWTEEQKLLASDREAGDLFGYSAALSENAVVVGAEGDDDNGFHSGSAYVFRYNGSSWVQEAKLLPSDGAAEDRFGVAVAMSGDAVVVGVPSDDDAFPADSRFDSGSAYVFRYDGSSWAQEAKLLASYGERDDQFGSSVAISGDTAVVGAFREDGVYPPWSPDVGAAYAFLYDGSSWVEEAKLLASDGAHTDWFGESVAISDGAAVIGAYLDDDNGEGSGSAYVFPGLSDCNSNGRIDTRDVADGTSPDRDGNGVPDECDFPGDLDGDGDVDLSDLAILLAHYGMTEGATYADGDMDFDGDVDLADLAALLAVYGTIY